MHVCTMYVYKYNFICILIKLGLGGVLAGVEEAKYALVRQTKTLVGDFVANLRTVCHYLIFYLTNIL